MRVPSTGKPSHIMVGFDRPGGGVRLYASRNLYDTGWASRDTGKAANVWHLDADMDHVLIIDGKSWGEVYARAFQIWENHDRLAAEEKRLEDSRKALSARRASYMEPKEIEDGSKLDRHPVILGEISEDLRKDLGGE